MEIIQIVGYILYAILIFITITWAYGVRVKPLVYPTVLSSLYFLITAIVFSLTEISKIHLLWVMPLVYLGAFLNITLMQIPIISTLLKIICDIYASILRIGIDKAKIERKKIIDTRSFIEEWAAKHKK